MGKRTSQWSGHSKETCTHWTAHLRNGAKYVLQACFRRTSCKNSHVRARLCMLRARSEQSCKPLPAHMRACKQGLRASSALDVFAACSLRARSMHKTGNNFARNGAKYSVLTSSLRRKLDRLACIHRVPHTSKNFYKGGVNGRTDDGQTTDGRLKLKDCYSSQVR